MAKPTAERLSRKGGTSGAAPNGDLLDATECWHGHMQKGIAHGYRNDDTL